MKLNSYLLCGMALVLLTSEPNIYAMETSGTSGKLEWKVVRDFQLSSPPVDIAYSLDGKYVFILTPNSEVLVYDASKTLQGIIPVDEGVTSIALDPRAQFLHLSNRKERKLYTLVVDFTVNVNTENSHIKGQKDAPVTIAVFSDFQ